MNRDIYQEMKDLMNSREAIYEEDRKIEVPTKVSELVSANIVKVKAGTTGYRGGDSGHGGRTVFKLTNLGGTDMRVSINGSGYFGSDEVGIAFGGDCELDTFIQSLEFALQTLKEQIRKQ